MEHVFNVHKIQFYSRECFKVNTRRAPLYSLTFGRVKLTVVAPGYYCKFIPVFSGSLEQGEHSPLSGFLLACRQPWSLSWGTGNPCFLELFEFSHWMLLVKQHSHRKKYVKWIRKRKMFVYPFTYSFQINLTHFDDRGYLTSKLAATIIRNISLSR